MRTKLTVVAVTCFILFLSGVLTAEESVKGFTVTALDGKTIQAAAFKGKLLVVNIGSHW